jgi:nicotinate-nucleotide pyrophosphorylase (carboxylating)
VTAPVAKDRIWSEQTIRLIHAACDEDLGRTGDATSALLGQPDVEIAARLVSRSDGVICGLALGSQISQVFAQRLRQELGFEMARRGAGRFTDGQPVAAGQQVALLRGPKAAVLAVERTLLNFLGRMSGVATLTHRYVQTARQARPEVQVLDTRKTLPGWRELDKYAVRTGGGTNHRMGLYDAILIKDNHLAGIPDEQLASRLAELLKRRAPSAKFVEVEVDRLDQLREVCQVAGVDIILLDNFSLEDLRAAVRLRDERGLRGKLALEASGKVSLENIAEIAATGVDRISVGALTHSAVALDLGLDF